MKQAQVKGLQESQQSEMTGIPIKIKSHVMRLGRGPHKVPTALLVRWRGKGRYFTQLYETNTYTHRKCKATRNAASPPQHTTIRNRIRTVSLNDDREKYIVSSVSPILKRSQVRELKESPPIRREKVMTSPVTQSPRPY